MVRPFEWSKGVGTEGRFLYVGAAGGGVRHQPAGRPGVEGLAGGGSRHDCDGLVHGVALRRVNRRCLSELDGGPAVVLDARPVVVAVGQDMSTAVGGLDQGLWARSSTPSRWTC